MIHKSTISDFENLGADGMAFTVTCCAGTPQEHSQRHTLHRAHLYSDAELKQRLTKYAKDHAEAHLAGERNHARVQAMAEGGEVCHLCGSE